MADRFMQPFHDNDADTSLQRSESVWMAHWKHGSLRSENEAHNQLSFCYKSNEDKQNVKQHHPLPSVPETEKDGSKLVKGFGEVTKSKMINLMNDSLPTSSGKLKNEASKSKSFPMFKCSQDKESVLALKSGEASSHHEEVLRLHVGLNSRYASSSYKAENCLSSTPACAHTNPEEPVKSDKVFEKNSLVVSTPFQDDILGSTSKIVPYQVNTGRIPVQSVCCHQDDINQPSTSLFNENKIDKNAAQLMHGPSTSNYQLRDYVSGKFLKMPNHSDIEFFPPEVSRVENLYHSSLASTRIPSAVHDVETMRICTAVDSGGGNSGGPQAFSQTTHHFLITKKTDVNLSDGAQLFRESTLSTRLKGKEVSELLNFSPGFGFHVKQGVKLQPLESSTESDGKEKIEDVKTCAAISQKESSAETDTMDMDIFRQHHLCGVASSAVDKDIQEAQKVMQEKIKGKIETELLDINQGLPLLPDAANSADERETSTSRTKSLDVECLLSDAEHPVNLKSGTCCDKPLGLDPCSRWVKRLKPSASEPFAYGTKSSKMGEASSHEKVNNYFNRILKCGKTGSELKMSESCDKNQMAVDLTAGLLGNAGSSSTDLLGKKLDVTLSHAWIQRWCHNQSAFRKEKPKAVVVSEPDDSKATLDDFQRKQFPSIAAMALMGKAMIAFRPCEFRKRGSFVVWS